MSKARLLGLIAPAQAGKSTVAEILQQKHHFVRLPFARPLKAMMRVLLDIVMNYDVELVDRMLNEDLKEQPIAALRGTTARRLMQTLGTEWRDTIYPEMWVDIWQTEVGRLMDQGQPVVTDDVRFPWEADAIKAMGGQLIRIRRDGVDYHSGHASEGALWARPVDWSISNSGTFGDLEREVRISLRALS